MMKYDFSGWATKNDLKCSDGRIIRKDAFIEDDGQVVPLVWNHQHGAPENILGHALLENRADGVYAYCNFNDTESGQTAKSLVNNGDVSSLSIYANRLKQDGSNVLHGAIREVSLVLAGANPGAFIDQISMAHGDDSDGEAIIYTGENILQHSEDKKKEEPEEKKEETKEAKEETKDEDKEDSKMAKEKSLEEIYESLDDDQKRLVDALVDEIANDEDEDEEETKDKDEEEEDTSMKHNVFDNETNNNVLTHSDIQAVFADAPSYGSLKEACLAHGIYDIQPEGFTPGTQTTGSEPTWSGYDGGSYGIGQIDYLFPDHKNIYNQPQWLKRKDEWVATVMGGIHHTPFSRIKTMFADITMDKARALGYVKGKKKKEEVFALLKRVTDPTTIYKKQKLDRDDIVDITDFDVVSWIKTEMRTMLDEEIARAILIGDGRSAGDDKIDETKIRPIWKDDELFTINKGIAMSDIGGQDLTSAVLAKEFIRTCIRSRKDYRGSGNVVLFTSEDLLTSMLLLEDLNGRIIYDTVEKLATALRVKKIVTLPQFATNDVYRNVDNEDRLLLGMYADLSDYNIGADKGGSINMFDDFDIDYNAQKFLMETRCSGALIKPYSAVVIELTGVTPPNED